MLFFQDKLASTLSKSHKKPLTAVYYLTAPGAVAQIILCLVLMFPLLKICNLYACKYKYVFLAV